MLTAAVLPALGIGDALLMMIASHHLKMEGYRVTTFHHALPELASWFPTHDLQTVPSLELLKIFDLILVENDNSPKMKVLLDTYRSRLSIFYPTYSPTKHAPLSTQDYLFDEDLPMADNIAKSVATLLKLPLSSKENGLLPPSGLIHRLRKEQIVFHPTSRVPAKNWKAKGFLDVARKLKLKGFQPLFCVGPAERGDWAYVEEEGFALANLPTLSALAAVVYESGIVIGNDSLIGHLGSNLAIPTLIIANDEKRMRLWRPGWQKGDLVLPPPYLPNWKFLRLREQKWQRFITPRKVLRSFDQLLTSST
ncbi:MAG: glycosyltransferase family 9 protein [Rhabdochlamydiaceae bacterium]